MTQHRSIKEILDAFPDRWGKFAVSSGASRGGVYIPCAKNEWYVYGFHISPVTSRVTKWWARLYKKQHGDIGGNRRAYYVVAQWSEITPFIKKHMDKSLSYALEETKRWEAIHADTN